MGSGDHPPAGNAGPGGEPAQSAENLEVVRWLQAEELPRIEGHLTAQIQAQQQRIATILAANGLLLGFLADDALFSPRDSVPWEQRMQVAAVVGLSAALMAGVLALLPKIGISSPPHLTATWLQGGVVPEGKRRNEIEKELLESEFQRLREAQHVSILERRRALMYVQLLLIAGSAALILIGVVGASL